MLRLTAESSRSQSSKNSLCQKASFGDFGKKVKLGEFFPEKTIEKAFGVSPGLRKSGD